MKLYNNGLQNKRKRKLSQILPCRVVSESLANLYEGSDVTSDLCVHFYIKCGKCHLRHCCLGPSIFLEYD